MPVASIAGTALFSPDPPAGVQHVMNPMLGRLIKSQCSLQTEMSSLTRLMVRGTAVKKIFRITDEGAVQDDQRSD